MTDQLRLGLAQCRQTEDFDTNANIVFNMLEKAAAQRVQLLCFPETHTVGYRVDVTATDAPVPIKQLEQLYERVAKCCGQLGIACVLGTETPLPSNPGPDPAHGKPYNSTLVINEQGKVLGTHHKTRLTPLDAIAYSTGEAIETFELCGVTVGIVICFEGFRFAQTTRQCVAQGAQLVLHPQNNTTRPNDWKVPVHHAMITTRAAENTIYFASCNACWPEHQNCSSMIVGPDGLVVAQAPLRHEHLLVADLDISKATRAMYLYDTDRSACAEMLFGNSVKREEYTPAVSN